MKHWLLPDILKKTVFFHWGYNRYIVQILCKEIFEIVHLISIFAKPISGGYEYYRQRFHGVCQRA